MLRNAKTLEGFELRARDGKIGHVSDFFFDDQRWTVRYLVVDTGTEPEHRKVLIAPAALGIASWSENILPVSLTCEQVRRSPPLDPAQPVTREHEAALRQYYDWPAYWSTAAFPEVGLGMPMVPMTPLPPLDPPPASAMPERAAAVAAPVDTHLRSVRGVTGYHLAATDGSIGHVDDFLLDDRTWEVRYLVVDTRNWWPGKKVIVAPQWIREVSWEEANVHVALTRAAIKTSPPYDPVGLVTPDYSGRLHDHYQRPRHGG